MLEGSEPDTGTWRAFTAEDFFTFTNRYEDFWRNMETSRRQRIVSWVRRNYSAFVVSLSVVGLVL